MSLLAQQILNHFFRFRVCAFTNVSETNRAVLVQNKHRGPCPHAVRIPNFEIVVDGDGVRNV